MQVPHRFEPCRLRQMYNHLIFMVMEEQEIKQPAEIRPIEWEAESFEVHRRGWSWYLIAAIILLLVLVYAIYVGRWLLGGVTVMVGVVLYLSGRMSPEKVSCRIDGQGIVVGHQTFAYDQLKTFWISTTPTTIKLNLISVGRFTPVISLLLKAGMEEEVRGTLGNRLPESKNRQDDWVDRINRFLRI